MTHALIPAAAVTWITGKDTGLSSKAIWTHMVGSTEWSWGWPHYPHDPDDLGRCLRLLELVPLWKLRIGEMARHNRQWAALVARWAELTSAMADEVGIDWSKGRSAPKTYALMRSILDEADRMTPTPEGDRE